MILSTVFSWASLNAYGTYVMMMMVIPIQFRSLSVLGLRRAVYS